MHQIEDLGGPPEGASVHSIRTKLFLADGSHPTEATCMIKKKSYGITFQKRDKIVIFGNFGGL